VVQLCIKCIDVTLPVYYVQTICMYFPSFLAKNEYYHVISIYIYIYIGMHVFMFIYVYIYIYTHTYTYIHIYICTDEDFVAVCCNVVPGSAEWCCMLQCVAVCCSVLQCVAVCCNVLLFCTTISAIPCDACKKGLQHAATRCNTLQHLYELTATFLVLHVTKRCTTQQHTATHCNTLQHTATHCNTFMN